VSNLIDIDAIDKSGLVRETAEAAGIDRRDLLRKGALGAGGLVAGSAFFGILSPAEAAISSRKKSKANDVKILQYAMTLELLEAAFYKEALDNKVFGNDDALARFTTVVADHEADHVAFLRKALGSKAVKGLEFDFGKAVTDVATYRATAQILEDTGVAAYAGQGPNIAQRAVVSAALSIHSVEARHAAWIRFLNGGGAPGAKTNDLPAPRTFDRALSERAVLRAVGATGFIQD
jgi:rubrerythrin